MTITEYIIRLVMVISISAGTSIFINLWYDRRFWKFVGSCLDDYSFLKLIIFGSGYLALGFVLFFILVFCF